MRLLAIDPGEKRIGLAVSDELELQARPLLTLERRGLRTDIARIVELAEGRRVGEIVVGLPLDLAGTEGPAAKRVRRFARALQAKASVPVTLFDERLTTAQAEQSLLAGDVSRAERRRRRDELAASILLETYLARRKTEAG